MQVTRSFPHWSHPKSSGWVHGVIMGPSRYFLRMFFWLGDFVAEILRYRNYSSRFPFLAMNGLRSSLDGTREMCIQCPYNIKATARKKSVVQVRVDSQIKKKAVDALDEMGLSLSEIVRVLLVRVGQEQAVPFEVRVPNPETIKAIEAGRRGEVARFKSVKGLMEDLNADD